MPVPLRRNSKSLFSVRRLQFKIVNLVSNRAEFIMKVLGLLLTLTSDSQTSSLERSLHELPGLTLGDREGSYLAAVLEGDTTVEIDQQLDAIEQTLGVALVQVVGAYWDEPDGDEAHRLRGKQKIRRELNGNSLNGGSR